MRHSALAPGIGGFGGVDAGLVLTYDAAECRSAIFCEYAAKQTMKNMREGEDDGKGRAEGK